MVNLYRKRAHDHLAALVSIYYPALFLKSGGNEYRKMIELTTKMTIVGRACTELTGHVFDERRERIANLYGACCFLGDSFLDDFGERLSREYIERLQVLLQEGWFEIRNDRERLFYVILSRLFRERDIFEIMLRQAIFSLFLTQKHDAELRLDPSRLDGLSQRARLTFLKQLARDRGGYTISALTLFLIPHLTLEQHRALFPAGSLLMYIDDHGDCFLDLHFKRITYMNQVKAPARVLRGLYEQSVKSVCNGFGENDGRNLMIGFLFRYFVTRLEKHRIEQSRTRSRWVVYE
jgi:hypothetical protein